MERKITRTKGKRFCSVIIRLDDIDGNLRLSITGEEGRVLTPAAARKEAREYWASYFDEDPSYIHEMNARCGTNFRSSKSAAKYVTDSDGEYHGLDANEVGNKVHVIGGCGCIHDTVAKWFPEIKPLIQWHLNDMHAGCEHQDQLNWGHGVTIALTKNTLTPAQKETIDRNLMATCEKKRSKEFDHRWDEIIGGGNKAIQAIRETTGRHEVSVSDMEELSGLKYGLSYTKTKMYVDVRNWLTAQVEKDIQPEVFNAQIYADSLMAPCPVCGYEYGSMWLTRKLPDDIVELAKTALQNE